MKKDSAVLLSLSAEPAHLQILAVKLNVNDPKKIFVQKMLLLLVLLEDLLPKRLLHGLVAVLREAARCIDEKP